MKTLVTLAASAAMTAVLSGGIHAHEHKMKEGMHGDHGRHAMAGVKIVNAWARATPGMVRNGGAYLTVVNPGKTADRLVGAKGDIATRVEIHTHLNDNGVMRMRRVDGIDVPAGGSVQFRPGSYHVMLIGLHAPLKKGATFPVKLVFEKAGEIETTVHVKSVGAMGGGMKHDMKHDMKKDMKKDTKPGGHGHGGHK